MDKQSLSHRNPNRPTSRGYNSRPIIRSPKNRSSSAMVKANIDIRPTKISNIKHIELPANISIKSQASKSNSNKSSENKSLPRNNKEAKDYSDFPVPKRNKLKFNFRHNNQRALAFPSILILAIFLMAVLGWQAGQIKNENLSKAVAVEAQYETDIGSGITVYDTDPVSEKERQKYIVDSNMPRFLQIQKINLNSRIQKVNSDSGGNINMPKNIYDIGWYEGSAKPGEKGVSFLNGQANYNGGPAVFANLGKLVKGDEIAIETGGGNYINYKVVKTNEIPAEKIKLINLLDPVEIEGQGLTLMTLSGQYDQKTKTYPNRTVVFAEKI